ncbi:MAG TPA: hypothetical protein DGT21_07470 [Armatimonadetes bacterium]|nr:hypothetical protein [Armatimonadota bacterium]
MGGRATRAPAVLWGSHMSGQAQFEPSAEYHETAHPSPWIYGWLATVPLIWGFNFVCLKILYHPDVGFTVEGMLSARYIIMALLFGAILLLQRNSKPIDRGDYLYLFIFALVTVGIYQWVFAKAIQLTSAAESALLISTSPIWVFLISFLMGTQRFDARRMIGVAVGFAGVAMVIFGAGKSADVADTRVLGDFVMIVAAILWASYAVFSHRLLEKYSPLKIVATIHLLGAIVLIPIGFGQMISVEPWSLGLVPWLCILQYSVLAGVYAFWMWYRGVKRIGASQTMLFQYFVPLVALVAGYLILHEIPTQWQIAGIVVTILGVHLARKQAPPQIAVTESEPFEELEEEDEVTAIAEGPSA